AARAAQQRAQQEAAQKALRQPAPQVATPKPVPPPKVAAQPAPIRQASPSPAPAPRQVALSPAATVVPAPNRSGYTINQRNGDGSNVVVQQSVLPTGGRQVTAYRQFEDPRTRTSTRTYYDGYR